MNKYVPGDDNLIAARVLADGRIVELWGFLFNWRLMVSDPGLYGVTVDDQWCFASERGGLEALAGWNGDGEPMGWVKHPASGRWRPDGDPTREGNSRRW